MLFTSNQRFTGSEPSHHKHSCKQPFVNKRGIPRVCKNHLPSVLETFFLMSIIFLCTANVYTINKRYVKMQKDLAYVSGSIFFLFVIVYHVYTEIVVKNKFWIHFKKVHTETESYNSKCSYYSLCYGII